MRKSNWISAGLFGAWALHDVEELLTMARSSKELGQRAPDWLPIPQDIRREGLSQRHINTGVGIMALFMAVASLDGARTGGRSGFFQTVLQGFGWHGIGHLAISGLAREYVSGVATAPVVVIPYWLWARRELARGKVLVVPVQLRAFVAVPAVILGTHAVTRVLTRRPHLRPDNGA
ncbi:MAG: HXXEE domain-containing protein [Frankiaceae bacterium]